MVCLRHFVLKKTFIVHSVDLFKNLVPALTGPADFINYNISINHNKFRNIPRVWESRLTLEMLVSLSILALCILGKYTKKNTT